MSGIESLIYVLCGLIVGVVLVFFVNRKSTKKNQLQYNEQIQGMKDAFMSLSLEALKSNNEAFLTLAKTSYENLQNEAKNELDKKEKEIQSIVKPVEEKLTQFDKFVREIEKERAVAYKSIEEQVNMLIKFQDGLKTETSNLVNALKTSSTRGRWGEFTLRRVVEMAGMLNYCDFLEQQNVKNDEEKNLRPDMIIKLPDERIIIVDAKAPLSGYLDASNAKTEEERKNYLGKFAEAIGKRVSDLSKKAYQEQFDSTPEFVIMFIPGENFFRAALEVNPSLVENGIKDKVIIATPVSLIALLKTIAYGWKQEALALNAKKIYEASNELYSRLKIWMEEFKEVGSSLDKAVEKYNKAVASLDHRFMPSVRRLGKLNVIDENKKIANINKIEKNTKKISSSELLSDDDNPKLLEED